MGLELCKWLHTLNIKPDIVLSFTEQAQRDEAKTKVSHVSLKTI